MTETPEVRPVDTLTDLVEAVELASITVHEQSAKRVENDVEVGSEPSPLIEAFVRVFDGGIETRFKMTFEGPGYVIVSDIALFYKDLEEFELDANLVPEFLNEVAVMAAYPYLREGVTTSASRLDVERPVLGIVRRGQVQFGQEDPRVEQTANGADVHSMDA